MPLKETIADSTDPGTLRPNIPPTTTTGTQFVPLECPPFDFKIKLPRRVAPKDAFGIWSLFFTQEQLGTIVQNTNDYISENQARCPRTKGARVVQLITLAELYGYLGILIYMSIHIENQTRMYWNTSDKMPKHTVVVETMAKNRWEDIHRFLHLSRLGAKDVFDKVKSNFVLYYIVN
jgi:hypothetical protein